MPRRRRVPKRRADPQVEANAWASVFESGFDFFDELAVIGLTDPTAGVTGTDAAKAEFRATAQDAWRRLGAAFMAGWEQKAVRERPWALEEFGAP
jgi:hypothetical protein